MFISTQASWVSGGVRTRTGARTRRNVQRHGKLLVSFTVKSTYKEIVGSICSLQPEFFINILLTSFLVKIGEGKAVPYNL